MNQSTFNPLLSIFATNWYSKLTFRLLLSLNLVQTNFQFVRLFWLNSNFLHFKLATLESNIVRIGFNRCSPGQWKQTRPFDRQKYIQNWSLLAFNEYMTISAGTHSSKHPRSLYLGYFLNANQLILIKPILMWFNDCCSSRVNSEEDKSLVITGSSPWTIFYSNES